MKILHALRRPSSVIRIAGMLMLNAFFAFPLLSQENFYADTALYRIEPMPVNSRFADWGAVEYNGNIVFASNRPQPRPSHLVHRIDRQTQADFYTLYTALLDAGGKTSDAERFARETAGRYNLGPVYIAPGGNTMIVTHNVEKKGQTAGDKAGKLRTYVLRLVFYTRDAAGQEWTDATEFAYNSNQYSCAHACLSPDGQQLYFSSDMPGTAGGMDIFVCRREGMGWGAPQNLGAQVNTAGNEIFPCIGSDGRTLYFSSDRAGGMGGLDVYRTELPATTEPQNLGAPINSPHDDFALSLYGKDGYGYLSSNRPLELDNRIDTSDNIYRLRILPPKVLPYDIAVVDSLTGQPIPAGITVLCLDCPDGAVPVTHTLPGGKPLEDIPLRPDRTYEFTVTHDGFPPQKHTIIPGRDNKDIMLRNSVNTIIKGVVMLVDAAGARTVPGGVVAITDNRAAAYRYQTDSNGRYVSKPFPGGRNLEVTASAGGLASAPVTVALPENPAELKPEYIANLTLYTGGGAQATAGAQVKVWFHLDKYSLTPQAKASLDAWVASLAGKTDITVVLTGHTDSRGPEAYNKALSLQRALSVQNYLVSKGLKPSRIMVEAYGYSRPMNRCAKGVSCTEAEHRENRRVEVFVND